MSIWGWAGFVAACAAGAIGRYLVDTEISKRAARLPVGTWVVNVSGSLVLGLLTGLSLSGQLGPQALAVAGTGFCGAYTTFSAFTFETVRLGGNGGPRLAATYALGSLAAGLVAAGAGLWLSSAWSSG